MRIRSLVLFCLMLAACAMHASAQYSDEEKKEMFLKAREDIEPVAEPTATSVHKKHHPKPASNAPHATPTPQENTGSAPEPTETPVPKPEETPKPHTQHHETVPEETPEPTPQHHVPKPAPEEEKSEPAVPVHESTPEPKHEEPPPPPPKPVPTPQPRPVAAQRYPMNAPISIEKSGVEQEEGFVAPPPSHFGGIFQRYHYLTPSVRRAIDDAHVLRGRWKYIVVHNSGTRQGNARIFDIYHRRVRHMPNGLAYQFVIGNGTSSGDGQIEIGDRWVRQINGGHCASDYLNNIALGICLVGDFNRDLPTRAQIEALEELIPYLRHRVGTVNGHEAIVKGHKEINPKPTDCPGDRFPLHWLHQRFGY